MNTDMLMYLLGGTGAALGGKGSWQEALGTGAQQMQSSKSYADMLQQLLGAGGKMTMDKEKFSMSGPTSALNQMLPNKNTQGLENFVGPNTQQSQSKPNQTLSLQNMLSGVLNPSPSPLNIAGANLVGLTPEMIQSALALKQNQQQIEQQRLRDVANMIYTGALTRESMIRGDQALNPPAAPQAPIEMPGIGRMSLEEWKSMPTEARAYAYYSFDEQRRGDKPASFSEFKSEAPKSAMIQLIELANEDEAFNNKLMEYRKAGAGATNINVGDRSFESAVGKAKADVYSPNYPQEVKERLMKDSQNWHMPPGFKSFYDVNKDNFKSRQEAKAAFQYMMVLQVMENEIRAAHPGSHVVVNDEGIFVDGEFIRPLPEMIGMYNNPNK